MGWHSRLISLLLCLYTVPVTQARPNDNVSIQTPAPANSAQNPTPSSAMDPILASALAGFLAKNNEDKSPGGQQVQAMLLGGAMAPAAAPLMSFSDSRSSKDRQPGFKPFPPLRPHPGNGEGTLAHITSVSGKGAASVYDCWNSHIASAQESWTWFRNHTEPLVSTKTVTGSTMLSISNKIDVAKTTLCDGIPRVLERSAVEVELNFPSETQLSVIQVTPGPAVTCAIRDTECNPAWEAYSTATFRYMSSEFFRFFLNAEATKRVPHFLFGPLQPPCESVRNCPAATESPSCSLSAERGTLFFWPSTFAPNEYCSKTSSTAFLQEPTNPAPKPTPAITPQSPSIITAVLGSLTLISPTAVLILHSLDAQAHDSISVSPAPAWIPWTRCGARLSSATLLVPAPQLSTYRSAYTATYIDPGKHTEYRTGSSARRFEAGDFAGPASARLDAVDGQGGFFCDRAAGVSSNCPRTITAGEFRPALAVPSAAFAPWVGEQGPLGKGQAENAEKLACGDGKIDDMTYVPITAEKVEMPKVTKFEAVVTVGPIKGEEEPQKIERYLSTIEEKRITTIILEGEKIHINHQDIMLV